MTRFRLAAITLLTLCALGPGKAAAVAGSPTDAIKRTNDQLNGLLRKQKASAGKTAEQISERLTKTVNAFLDFEELAKRALGKHWDKRSGKERKQFVEILSKLIEKSYVKQLKSNLDYRLEYRGEKVSGEQAEVKTVVKVKREGRTEEVEIAYKMQKTKRGWMVYDMITDEVSVVRNYRSQFNRIISRDSYEVLVKKMKAKLQRI
ncbi:MAG: ABC transporter substrate-binding protein [Deltaproteobacteria bacterium]|nr:ABC transporter substrate-binding protein [Deltaproteobacteria bacterium]